MSTMSRTTTIIILLLAMCLFVGGCTEEGIKTISKSNPFQSEPIIVNITLPEVKVEEVNITIPEYDGTGIHYFISKDTIVAMSHQSTIVVDSETLIANKILKEYNRTPNAVIATLQTQQKAAGIKYVVLATPPNRVFDNGLDSEYRREYLKYADRLGVVADRVISDREEDYSGMHLSMFTPYEKGFSLQEDYNSIVVKINNLLYMSNCYGTCEEYMNDYDLEAEVIILANRGRCPTTSVEFILDTGAETIIGEEFCNSLEDLRYIGLNFVELRDKIASFRQDSKTSEIYGGLQ